MTTPAIAPRQDIPCAICGTMGSPDKHHEIPRSKGGTDGPTMYACRRCHTRLHPEKNGEGWVITESSTTRLAIADSRTGEIIMERHTSSEFDEGDFIQCLQEIPDYLNEARALMKYLSPDGMIETSNIMARLDQESWKADATLIRHAVLLVPYGERGEKFKAVIQALGIGKSKAYNLLTAMKAVEDHPELFLGVEIPPLAVIEVMKSGDPEKAMELWRDRIAGNVRYSVAQLRADLNRGNDSNDPEPVYCVCEGCGSKHVRKE